LAEELGFTKDDDGSFYMTIEEIKKFFTNISVSFYKEEYELDCFEVKNKNE
jgi:hypothetical protein